MESNFVKTGHKNVLINFDIENKNVKQLLGFELTQFSDDTGFYFNMLLNCDLQYHPFKNYLEMYAMHVDFTPIKLELTNEIWYNLVQMCYQDKFIMLDGEVLATDLPTSENKRFDEVWNNSDEMYSDIRQELKPY